MARRCPSFPIVLPTIAAGLVSVLPLALACNPDEVPPLPVVPSERAIYSPAEVMPAGKPCRVVFSPDEAIRLDVEASLERWSLATGCTLEVTGAGVPVAVVASIVRPDGSQSPGMTTAGRDRVEVNVRILRNGQLAPVLLHELGHALGGDHTESMGVLSGHKGHSDVIDVEALETVCSRLPCPAFNPEAP